MGNGEQKIVGFQWTDELVLKCFERCSGMIDQLRLEDFKKNHQVLTGGWSVIQFVYASRVFDRYEDGYRSFNGTAYILSSFDNTNCIIRKVQRESDGFVLELDKAYTVSDTVPNALTFTIERFHKDKNALLVIAKEFSYPINAININSIVECNQILAYTNDGIPIRDMQTVFQITKNNYKIWACAYCLEWWANEEDDTVALLSTEEKAKEYVAEHKTYLSISMIRAALVLARGELNAKAVMYDIEAALCHIENSQA